MGFIAPKSTIEPGVVDLRSPFLGFFNREFLIRDNITDEKKRSKLKGLSDYLKNNLGHLVNYDERQKAHQVFTSQVAESHIDTLINARHKRKQKMQWTREGAHHVLQIRAMMESKEWDEHWLEIVLPAL